MPDPATVQDNVVPRAYWQEEQPDNRSGQSLTFELNKFEAWSFPRTQLIRFEIGFHPVEDDWHPQPGKILSRLGVVLQFPGTTVIVHAAQPDLLLKAILSGCVSVLARGRALTGRVLLEPEETTPSEQPNPPNYIRTGRIKVTTTYE